MLTKLKADPQLKGIPVMMLTAEGGRDNVLKIAKIGIRDYIIKPFKEEVLVEKVGRIIDLKPLADGPTRVRSILDPADILVVEDKPAIVQQIQEGLKHTTWRIHGVSTQGEAIDFCARQIPDLVIVSLSLPEEAAFTLFRTLRTNAKTKYTPVFGLVVKTETAVQDAAQQMGVSAIVTKPIDMGELESKMAKAMNLDMSRRYFDVQGEFLVMMLPENSSPSVLAEASNYLKVKLSEAVDSGINKAIVDLHSVKTLHMGLIKLLMHTMQTCRDLAVHFALVGNTNIATECKGFEDTRAWTFYDTMDEAKANLGKAAPAPAPAQLATA
jgi:two-component system, cell cycle response regulator